MPWIQDIYRPLRCPSVVTFEAIHGLKSEADYTTFPAKTKSIKGQYVTKAVSLSQVVG